METNNYTTDLQLVSQEYSDEKTSLQTKTKKLLEHFSPKDIWKNRREKNIMLTLNDRLYGLYCQKLSNTKDSFL